MTTENAIGELNDWIARMRDGQRPPGISDLAVILAELEEPDSDIEPQDCCP
jgi:hypothetical protein